MEDQSYSYVSNPPIPPLNDDELLIFDKEHVDGGSSSHNNNERHQTEGETFFYNSHDNNDPHESASTPPPPLIITDEVQQLLLSKHPPPNHALAYVTLSITTFLITKSLFNRLAPQGAKCQGPVTVWKWVNTANSLVHSAVTGVGAAVCVYLNPRSTLNVVSTFSDFSHRLTSYSVGYFLFDIGDMLANHRKRSSYELIVHHLFVLTCFILSITTRYYLAFTTISLMVELNSIFLHWRQLLLITLTPKHSSPHYKTVSLLNLTTFLTFRISVLGWMIWWMAGNRRLVDPAPYWLGVVSIVGLIVMSLVLWGRLVRADLEVFGKGVAVTTTTTTATPKDCCNNNNNNNNNCDDDEEDDGGGSSSSDSNSDHGNNSHNSHNSSSTGSGGSRTSNNANKKKKTRNKVVKKRQGDDDGDHDNSTATVNNKKSK